MKKLIAMCIVLIPAIAAAGELFAESMMSSSESSTESTDQSAKVQIAYATKRDAEAYLAGVDMTRSLQLVLDQLQSEHPDVESDELVGKALEEADTVIALNRTTQAPE